MGDVGLGADTRVVPLWMTAGAVTDLVDGERGLPELGHLGGVVVAGDRSEAPDPLAAVKALVVEGHGSRAGAKDGRTRTSEMARDDVGLAVAGAGVPRCVRVLDLE